MNCLSSGFDPFLVAVLRCLSTVSSWEYIYRERGDRKAGDTVVYIAVRMVYIGDGVL